MDKKAEKKPFIRITTPNRTVENLEEEKEIKIREREEKNGKSIFCQKEHRGEKYHKRARISSPEEDINRQVKRS